MSQEMPEMDLDAGECLQCPQVHQLPHGLTWIAGPGMDARGEVLDPLNRVTGKQESAQLADVKPLEWCALTAPEVQIEGVHIDEGLHGQPQ